MGLVVLFVVVLAAFVVATFLSVRVRRAEEIGPATSADRVAHQIAMDRQSAENLLTRYDLRGRETEFFGEWREMQLHGHRVAFQPGSPLSIVVGNFDPDEEQLTEVYLSKVSPTRPMPESRGRRLDSDLGDGSSRLAEQYFLNASLPRDHALKVAEVREALLALSPSVLDVMIFETHGVQLDLDPTRATQASLGADLERAAEIVATLSEGDRPLHRRNV